MRLVLLAVSTATLVSVGCASGKKQIAPATPVPVAAVAPAKASPAPVPAMKAVDTKVAPAASAAVEKKPEKKEIAPDTKAAESSKLVCVHAEVTRSVEIEKAEPKGCGLFYERDGKREKVAWSDQSVTHCETVRDRIRGKLETGGFKCSEGGKATVAAATAPAQPAAAVPAAPAAPAQPEKKPSVQ